MKKKNNKYSKDDLNDRNHDNKEDEFPEYIIVTDVLDLHGFFPEQVPDILTEFIRNAIALQIETVRIIHGKGRSKMKWSVHQVLKKHSKVLAFGDARPELGGWGATIAHLKLD